jgi:hypothetical protein
MTIDNTLRIQLVNGYEPELEHAEAISFDTYYPGGLFGTLSFLVRRDVTRAWQLAGHQMIRVTNGLETVWEGETTAPAYIPGVGFRVDCLGYWAGILEARRWRKPWADTRLELWQYDETRNGAEKCNFDQRNRLRFTPKNETWGLNDNARLVLRVPTGETIKRISGSYALSEQAQVSPSAVVTYTGAAYTDQADVCDGDTATADGITLLAAWYLYIGKRDLDCFSFLNLDLGPTFNTNAATLTAEYSAGIDDAGTTTWTALAITDNTAAAGKPFAQDGTITFTKPPGWGEGKVDGSTMYWLRLKTSANLTAVTFNEVTTCETQAWQLELYDLEFDDHPISVTTTSSGTFDFTLATPSNGLYLYFSARAKQTPPSNGTVYGELSNVTVYTETGSINLTEIAKDVRAHESDLSTSLGQIASNTYALVPFVSEDERLADCLMRAAGYGDSAANAWAVSIVESALGTDGKPVLRVAQQPALTAHDYALRLDEPNVQPGVVFRQNIADVRNWIAVKYRSADGRTVYLTPDDDAALSDSASVADYGERQEWLDVPTTSATTAKAFGVRYLAQYRDPRWQASGGITVKGYIRTAAGGLLPACRIRAGMRVKVENFLSDLSGSGLTLLISGTRYTAARETCTISVGVPDFLAVQMAQMRRG